MLSRNTQTPKKMLSRINLIQVGTRGPHYPKRTCLVLSLSFLLSFPPRPGPLPLIHLSLALTHITPMPLQSKIASPIDISLSGNERTPPLRTGYPHHWPGSPDRLGRRHYSSGSDYSGSHHSHISMPRSNRDRSHISISSDDINARTPNEIFLLRAENVTLKHDLGRAKGRLEAMT